MEKKANEIKTTTKKKTANKVSGTKAKEIELEQKAKVVQEALDKINQCIVLKSPLQYKPQTVLITELDQKDKDQLFFSTLNAHSGLLTNMLMAVNDLLLLFEAYAKKSGIPTEKIVNGKVIDYTKNETGNQVDNLGVDSKDKK